MPKYILLSYDEKLCRHKGFCALQGQAQWTIAPCATTTVRHLALLDFSMNTMHPASFVGTMVDTVSAHVANKVRKYLWLPEMRTQ